jgi:hypothetical protein
MISFCTWIKNRFYQFEQVYRINLERMRECDEWVIVDVDSDDEFSTWTIDDKRVKIHRISVEEIHFAKLYNISHKLGIGDIIVNLDADNFIGEDFCSWTDVLLKQKRLGHSWSNNWSDGTYGRISMIREHFYSVGGYDETFTPCGFQDTDIIQRIIKSGVNCYTTNDKNIYGGSIPNTRDDTMKYVDKTKTFAEYNSINHKKYLDNVKNNKLKVN